MQAWEKAKVSTMGLFDFLRSSRRVAQGRSAAEEALRDGKRRAVEDSSWDLHQAAYVGRVDVVRRLLAEGADPNGHHDEAQTGWHCGPTPLSKAICAWTVTADHVTIVELLLAHGARVDDSHFADWSADAMGTREDGRILQLLRDAQVP